MLCATSVCISGATTYQHWLCNLAICKMGSLAWAWGWLLMSHGLVALSPTSCSTGQGLSGKWAQNHFCSCSDTFLHSSTSLSARAWLGGGCRWLLAQELSQELSQPSHSHTGSCQQPSTDPGTSGSSLQGLFLCSSKAGKDWMSFNKSISELKIVSWFLLPSQSKHLPADEFSGPMHTSPLSPDVTHTAQDFT